MSERPPVVPQLMTLEEVATFLNVRPAQVYALVRSGDLPALKLGGRGIWRIDWRQLEAYLERVAAETAEWVKANPAKAEEVREDLVEPKSPAAKVAARRSARKS